MKVKLLVDGGEMKPGPVVSQQIGPLGLNLGKIISDVNTATSNFKGMKVPVQINIDTKTKSFSIEVFSPPVAELIKKELGIEKGSGQPGTIRSGNIAIESLIGIAKTKKEDLLAKDTKSALKTIIGSCLSLGILIDNKPANEIQSEVSSGKYDKEIEQEITKPSEEKKKSIDSFFADIKAEQEKVQKATEEAKAVEETAKAEKAAAAPAEEKKEEPKSNKANKK